MSGVSVAASAASHSRRPTGFLPKQHGFLPKQHGFLPKQHGFLPKQHGFLPKQHGFGPEQLPVVDVNDLTHAPQPASTSV